MKKLTSCITVLLSLTTLASVPMFSSAEEVQALVVDNGSGMTKNGFNENNDGAGKKANNDGFIVCHKGKLSLVIYSEKAAAKHLLHGDTEGECVE